MCIIHPRTARRANKRKRYESARRERRELSFRLSISRAHVPIHVSMYFAFRHKQPTWALTNTLDRTIHGVLRRLRQSDLRAVRDNGIHDRVKSGELWNRERSLLRLSAEKAPHLASLSGLLPSLEKKCPPPLGVRPSRKSPRVLRRSRFRVLYRTPRHLPQFWYLRAMPLKF